MRRGGGSYRVDRRKGEESMGRVGGHNSEGEWGVKKLINLVSIDGIN